MKTKEKPISHLAGQPAPDEIIIDVIELREQYYSVHPDPGNIQHQVKFGTSGHRGSSTLGTFNEDHVLAMAQAVGEYRQSQGIKGPLYLGMDSHALSTPAQKTTLEVLAAQGVEVYLSRDESDGQYTPTPAVSHAILTYNRGRREGLADGIIPLELKMSPKSMPKVFKVHLILL